MDRAELLERGELDHGANLAFEEDRENEDVVRRCLAEAGRDPDVVRRHLGQMDRLLVERALADEPFTESELACEVFARFVRVAGLEHQVRLGAVGVDHAVKRAVLGVDQRRQLRQDEARHGQQIALALQHSREPREVCLQPVLLLRLQSRLTEVADHLVDVVLEDRNLSARLHADRPSQVAFGHRGGHFRNRTHLRGQRG